MKYSVPVWHWLIVRQYIQSSSSSFKNRGNNHVKSRKIRWENMEKNCLSSFQSKCNMGEKCRRARHCIFPNFSQEINKATVCKDKECNTYGANINHARIKDECHRDRLRTAEIDSFSNWGGEWVKNSIEEQNHHWQASIAERNWVASDWHVLPCKRCSSSERNLILFLQHRVQLFSDKGRMKRKAGMRKKTKCVS